MQIVRIKGFFGQERKPRLHELGNCAVVGYAVDAKYAKKWVNYYFDCINDTTVGRLEGEMKSIVKILENYCMDNECTVVFEGHIITRQGAMKRKGNVWILRARM